MSNKSFSFDIQRDDPNSADGKMIKEIIDKGEIVPVKVTVNLLKKAMEKAGWADKKFLVDGFPRN